jgi:hypothetical protein
MVANRSRQRKRNLPPLRLLLAATSPSSWGPVTVIATFSVSAPHTVAMPGIEGFQRVVQVQSGAVGGDHVDEGSHGVEPDTGVF